MTPWFVRNDSIGIYPVPNTPSCYCVQYPAGPRANVGPAIQLPAYASSPDLLTLYGRTVGTLGPDTYEFEASVAIDLQAEKCHAQGSIYYSQPMSGDSGGTWGGGK